MRILILGGTRFLSREIALHAVAAGHDVTVAARGESGEIPAGTRHVVLDRSVPAALGALADGTYDAVVDIARRPSWVREAVEALGERTAHWTFVSSCSVYPDEMTPGQRSDAPIREPAPADADETDMELYGALKVSCERAVLDGLGDRAFICRPGLIVGPGDPSGRFTYWPRRLAAGGEVLAPGDPEDPVQIIDVRDLAAWLVTTAENGRTGVLDAISPPLGRGALLAEVDAGIGVTPELTWVPEDFLVENRVEPWMGPGSLPLWLPLTEYAGFMSRDVSESVTAGMQLRPFAQTARDTLAWVESTPDATLTGLTREEEERLLTAWHAQSSSPRPSD